MALRMAPSSRRRNRPRTRTRKRPRARSPYKPPRFTRRRCRSNGSAQLAGVGAGARRGASRQRQLDVGRGSGRADGARGSGRRRAECAGERCVAGRCGAGACAAGRACHASLSRHATGGSSHCPRRTARQAIVGLFNARTPGRDDAKWLMILASLCQDGLSSQRAGGCPGCRPI